MSVSRKYALLFVLICLVGCAIPPPLVKLDSTFDVSSAFAQLEPGTNTIQGSALIRQQGGGVVTCAGCKVYLLPVTLYATERIIRIYGNDQRGYTSRIIPRFEPDYPEYYQARRIVIGDSQGMFEFENLKVGEYYLLTTIYWAVGYNRQGGALMARVQVEGGETKKVVMAP